MENNKTKNNIVPSGEISVLRNVFFRPWVGKYYKTSAPKILVIGDSHYCGECGTGDPEKECGQRRGDTVDRKWYKDGCPNFTKDIIKFHLNDEEGKIRAYGAFDEYMIEHSASADDEETFKVKVNCLWNHIAFYNFVQTACSKLSKRLAYGPEDREKSIPYAESVIQSLKPDFIIFWGIDKLNPYEMLTRRWKDANMWEDDPYKCISFGMVSFQKSCEAYCMQVTHPSARKKMMTRFTI